jgi:hypothetical protein
VVNRFSGSLAVMDLIAVGLVEVEPAAFAMARWLGPVIAVSGPMPRAVRRGCCGLSHVLAVSGPVSLSWRGW